MGRRGRPKKKAITYDSKETKFVLGLLLFALSMFSVLSYFISDGGIFAFLKTIFGEATFLFSLFTLNLSLSLFGAEVFSTSRKSLLGQLFLLIFSAVLIATNAELKDFRALSYEGNYGGIIGYEIAAFSRESVLLNLTGFVSLVIVVLSLPFVLNMQVAEFFQGVVSLIKKLIEKIGAFLAWLTGRGDPSEELSQEQQMQEEANKTAMFGDFRSRFGAKDQSGPNDKPQGGQQTQAGGSPAKQNKESQTDEVKAKAPEFVGINSIAAGKSDDDDEEENSVKEESKGSTLQTELKYPDWQLPSADLLDPIPEIKIPKEDVENNSTIIEQTLASFGIESKVMDAKVGPSVTQYALDIALGIKVSKIANLKNDLALALATASNAVRIEVPIPGTSYVGIEIPNNKRRPVFFRELITEEVLKDKKMALPVTVGKGIAGKPTVANIQKMPHLLIAGATGSGKSVLTNSFIMSLLMKRSPDEVRFIMVDPKQVELSDYNGIPHLLTPVITEMDKVVNALKWAVAEMESRYTIFRENKVKNLEGYNKQMGFSALPYIVIVIDEMADMMLTSNRADIEANIVRLAQKARATGIHLILATQRPSVNVITGLIKANIPGRVGMSVTTNVDSRVILDVNGAESLLGKGDLLFKEPDKNKPYRVQGVFVSQPEVQRVVKFIKKQTEEVEYIENITVNEEEMGEFDNVDGISGDDLFAEAVKVIVSAGKGSSSLLQRKLSIGYNRAAKLIDDMHEVGVVGPHNGSKPREVLITDADAFLEKLAEV
jgi:S-DNA-T family DNA segregation ATPase FtsK/SpoIIIE